MLELYHWEPNGSYLKPLILLHEKGLAFRSRYVDPLSFEQYEEGFSNASHETQLNLEGEGPVLLHDAKQITESLFMLEYIEDAFPDKPLRPADALGHTRILAWARFINEVFMPAVSTLGCHQYLAPQLRQRRAALEPKLARIPLSYVRDNWQLALNDGYSAELLDDSRRKIALSVKRIEEILAHSPWLVGDVYSLADIDAFSICNSLPTLTPDIVNDTATPRLSNWLQRIRERSAVQTALRTSRTGKPELAFAPGPEHSRWG